jgi:hypothetical protein
VSGLSDYQTAFLAALDGETAALAAFGVCERDMKRGLSVHRNTVATGLIEAILDAYPTVVVLMGRDWTAGAARDFTRAHRPSVAGLIDYGRTFPTWLAEFEFARDFPYLADVARADRAWLEAHLAADADGVDASSFDSMSDEARVALHPSVRLLWSIDNAPTIWMRNRPPNVMEQELEHQRLAEGLLLVRRAGVVEHQRLDRQQFEFLRKIAAGRALLSVCDEALGAMAPDAFTAFLSDLLRLGVFAVPSASTPPSRETRHV